MHDILSRIFEVSPGSAESGELASQAQNQLAAWLKVLREPTDNQMTLGLGSMPAEVQPW